MKIHPVGAEFFHVDRWTDGQTDERDKTNITLYNFATIPKNGISKVKLQNYEFEEL